MLYAFTLDFCRIELKLFGFRSSSTAPNEPIIRKHVLWSYAQEHKRLGFANIQEDQVIPGNIEALRNHHRHRRSRCTCSGSPHFTCHSPNRLKSRCVNWRSARSTLMDVPTAHLVVHGAWSARVANSCCTAQTHTHTKYKVHPKYNQTRGNNYHRLIVHIHRSHIKRTRSEHIHVARAIRLCTSNLIAFALSKMHPFTYKKNQMCIARAKDSGSLLIKLVKMSHERPIITLYAPDPSAAGFSCYYDSSRIVEQDVPSSNTSSHPHIQQKHLLFIINTMSTGPNYDAYYITEDISIICQYVVTANCNLPDEHKTQKVPFLLLKLSLCSSRQPPPNVQHCLLLQFSLHCHQLQARFRRFEKRLCLC